MPPNVDVASSDLSTVQPPRRRHTLRWAILGLLFCASVINYIDRQSLSILARTIQDDLRISDEGYSTIVQFFLLAYMLSFLVAGWVTDRIGIRRSMTLFIAWWSVANLLTGLVGSMRQLAATRFLLGAGESGLYVVAPKVVSQIFPASQRGLAVGIYSAGATIGATIAPPLIAWLTLNHSYGWRAAFVVGGTIGLIWIIPWLLTYRAETPAVVAPTIPAAPAVQSGPLPLDYAAPRTTWIQNFLSKEVILLLLIRAITDPVWQFILFWFPKYMADARGMSLAEIGRIGWVPYLAADIGGVLGGLASGLLIKRGFIPVDARKWVMAVCAVMIPAGAGLVAWSQSSSFIVVMMAVIAFAEFTWMVTMTALAVDVLPTDRIGRMFGVIAAGSGLGGMLFMEVIPRLVESYSYTPVFVLMGCLHPIAFVLVWAVAASNRRANGTVDAMSAAAATPEVPQPEGVACK